MRVTSGASASVYRSVSGVMDDAPSWVGSALSVATEGGLVALGFLLLWVWWAAVRGRDARGVAGATSVGAGVVAAYVVSEALKLVVDEERPCFALPGVSAVTECPGAGDWSFPSNHAVLAAGIAAGLAVLRPRLSVVALPLAVVVALLRVVAGVHYPHDVVAGALIGATVAVTALLLVGPPVSWAVSSLFRRYGNGPGFLGPRRRSAIDPHAGGRSH
ncbi:phosphatase PAP2 family protein [Actinopolymorpha sp. B17G11]|uniref:phosphatase PAP2 family protein n=1 Tax=unclassified Actinopolymorpha TaxID=2627063 RepID=UPI0032D990F6